MTRLAKLYVHPTHKKIENLDFMLRIKGSLRESKANKSDCINMFIQLRFLYRAMEECLIVFKDTENNLLKFFEKSPWLNRSELLNTDILEMINYCSEVEKQNIVYEIKPAFKKFIQTMQTYNSAKLFACFAVQLLGDVFGGQNLKKYNQNIFEFILSSFFYESVCLQGKPLVEYVNKASLSAEEEADFESATDEIFNAHLELFNEMETERNVVRGYNPYRLFTIAAVVAASAGVAVALTR